MLNSMALKKSFQFNMTKSLEMVIIPMQNIQSGDFRRCL